MKAAVHHCIVYNPPPLHRLEAYTLSNRGRSPRHSDSSIRLLAGSQYQVPKDWRYWLPARGWEIDVVTRGQMLSHFPTVTKSIGFQPTPLPTPCSLLISHQQSAINNQSSRTCVAWWAPLNINDVRIIKTCSPPSSACGPPSVSINIYIFF